MKSSSLVRSDAGARADARAPSPLMLRLLLLVTGSFALASAAQAQSALQPGPGPDDPLFSIESPIGSIDYVVGRGLSLGRTGLHIGGFSTLEIDKQEGESGTVEIDGLNFLIDFEPVDFLRVFSELEVGHLLAYDTGGDGVSSDPSLTVERLYADLERSDAQNLRVGKFQTPVGIWNLVPAEPFTWTANEPILVETAFDEHQTGGALFGSRPVGSNNLGYWLYGQFMGPLDPPSDEDPVDRSVGGRVQYGGPLGWQIGGSFLASERNSAWNFLGGLDGSWPIGPLELQGEWALVRGDIPDRNLWGVYLQGAYDLGHHTELLRGVHLVARYEYHDPANGPAANIWNAGVAWSPVRFLILKADYQFADRRTDAVSRGLFTSLSILF